MRASILALLVPIGLLGPVAHADPGPDFTLRDLNGREVSLSAQRGKVVVLSFWATWCAPCRAELPHLQRLHARREKDGVAVITVSIDESAGKVRAMAQSQGWTFPVLLDPTQAVTRLYDPSRTVPTTVVVGPDGSIVSTHTGYAPGDERRLEAEVDRLLPGR